MPGMFENLLWLEEVNSTQEVVKSKNLPAWTVVVANRQRLGRGRLGRPWHSAEGGLYLSFSVPRGFRDECTLPLVVACAVADYLAELGFRPALKWVNDVYIKGRKVCGVLTEGLKDRLIVGVGINLNQEAFPPNLEAISLKMVSGQSLCPLDFLAGLLEQMEKGLKELFLVGFSALKERIEDRLLFKDSEVVLYTPAPVAGLLQGIGDDGSLLLLTQEGLRAFSVGELTLRPR